MPNEDHFRSLPTSLGFSVVTASDSRDVDNDVGGARLAELAAASGHRVTRRAIVTDDLAEIRRAIEQALAAADVDCVLLTGGTGVSPRDVSVEAVRPLLARELPGFGELFRALSFAEIGPAAMLSRATAGVSAGKALFLLPGSPAALELAMKRLILPEIGHLIDQARRER
jgi:molybdenum cofactor biosynthesis protein B